MPNKKKSDMVMFPDDLPEKENKQRNKTNNAFLGLSPKNDRKDPESLQSVQDAFLAAPIWNNDIVKSDEELIVRWDAYFQACFERAVRPTVEGLACAAGTNVSLLRKWETGSVKPTKGRQELVVKAKAYIQYILSTLALKGSVAPISWIFYGKNFFSMSDKVSLEVEQKNLLQSEIDPDEVRARILSAIPKEDMDPFLDIDRATPLELAAIDTALDKQRVNDTALEGL